jgi:hypothetical protein
LFLPKRTPSFSHTHPRFCPRNGSGSSAAILNLA